jgi:hypothetical protein
MNTNYTTPTMSQEEQDLYDLMLDDLTTQNEREDQLYDMQMQESGYIWDKTEFTEEELAAKSEYSGYTSAYKEAKKAYDQYTSSLSSGNLNADQMRDALQKQAYYYSEMMRNQDLMNTWETTWSDLNNKSEGEWRKMTEEELQASMTEAEWEKYQLGREQVEHSRKALAGELPLSEALLDQKQKEFEQLKEVYGITGDNPEDASGEDTIAIQNLDSFKKRWAQLEDQQRFGQSSSSMESAVLGQGLTTGQTANTIGQTSSLGFNNSLAGYTSLLQPLQAYRMAGYQTQAANQASQTSQFGSWLGLLGMLGAATIGSSKEFKKDIKSKSTKDEDKALKDVRKTKSYSYKYKPEMKMGNRKHIGTIAEESPASFSTGKFINLADKIEVLNMAVKSLDRKVSHAKS